MKFITVALDGPSGAGKSTIAKQVADQLKFTYIDTGAMYRAIAYGCLQDNIDTSDNDKVSQWLGEKKLSFNQENHICLNDNCVEPYIRTEKVSENSSIVASLPSVRTFAVNEQRKMAKDGNVILDGRDIGSVVFPNANVKIYLTASSEVRAQRRYLQNKEKGIECDYDMVYQDVLNRDYRDTHRDISPLIKVDDAIEIDSSDMTMDEVIAQIINLIQDKM